MAQFAFHAPNWSAAAAADGGALTNAQYMAIKGGSATQRINVTEIQIGGLSSTTSPCIMQWCRASTLETTPTALATPNSSGPKDPSSAVLAAPPVNFVAAATGPQKSSTVTDAKLDLSFNAFGGIVRWNVPWQEAWGILTATAPLGESILGAFTGSTTASVSAHIVHEPL